MNIHAKPGDKVIFTCDGGYVPEQDRAVKELAIGASYTVRAVDIGDTYSYVHLVEKPGTCFNTALFSDVVAVRAAKPKPPAWPKVLKYLEAQRGASLRFNSQEFIARFYNIGRGRAWTIFGELLNGDCPELPLSCIRQVFMLDGGMPTDSCWELVWLRPEEPAETPLSGLASCAQELRDVAEDVTRIKHEPFGTPDPMKDGFAGSYGGSIQGNRVDNPGAWPWLELDRGTEQTIRRGLDGEPVKSQTNPGFHAFRPLDKPEVMAPEIVMHTCGGRNLNPSNQPVYCPACEIYANRMKSAAIEQQLNAQAQGKSRP